MINIKALQQDALVKEHVKAYKVGKQWVFAGIFVLSTMGMMGADSTAHADATPLSSTTPAVAAQQEGKTSSQSAPSSNPTAAPSNQSQSVTSNTTKNNVSTPVSLGSTKAETTTDSVSSLPATSLAPASMASQSTPSATSTAVPSAVSQATSTAPDSLANKVSQTANSETSATSVASATSTTTSSANGSQAVSATSASSTSSAAQNLATSATGKTSNASQFQAASSTSTASAESHIASIASQSDASQSVNTVDLGDVTDAVARAAKNHASAVYAASKTPQELTRIAAASNVTNTAGRLSPDETTQNKQGLLITNDKNSITSWAVTGLPSDMTQNIYDASNVPTNINYLASSNGIKELDLNGPIGADTSNLKVVGTYEPAGASFNGQKISKIVVTFDKFSPYLTDKSLNRDIIFSNNLFGGMWTVGWDYDFTPVFYDQNGNVIDLTPKDGVAAFLSFWSLNNEPTVDGSWTIDHSSHVTGTDQDHVEYVQAMNGQKAYVADHSSVIVDNTGKAYAPHNNDPQRMFADAVTNPEYGGGIPDWDWLGNKDYALGAVMYQLNGGTNTFRVGMNYNNATPLFNNQSYWITFGSAPLGNTASPAPVKTVTDTSGRSIDGQKVLPGSVINYKVEQDINHFGTDLLYPYTNFEIDDTLPNQVNGLTSDYKLVAINNDGSQSDVDTGWYKIITSAQGVVSASLMSNILADGTSGFYAPTAKGYELVMPVSVKMDASGTLVNTASTNVGKTHQDTNTTHNPVVLITPTKTVTDQNGNDINGKNSVRGDTKDYEILWDLRDVDGTALTQDQINKGVSIWDFYPARYESIQKGTLVIKDANGKDISSEVSIDWDDADGKFTVSAKDPVQFITEHKGTEPKVDFKTTVKADVEGESDNTAHQNTFGNDTPTNTIGTHVNITKPTKEVVANTTDPTNIDGKSFALNTNFDYEVDSSTRPANYAGITESWTGSDYLDIKHDQYNGQTKIVTTQDITLDNGSVIKAGQDITNYFTTAYDSATGHLGIEMNSDLLKILNSPINKTTAQGWKGFIGVKAIAVGTATNKWQEDYNNTPDTSNTVTHVTPNDPAPTKTVDDDSGNDIDNKAVARGDHLDYNGTWDLTGFTNWAFNTSNFDAGFGEYDLLEGPAKMDPDSLKFADANSHDITDQLEITWGVDHKSFTVKPKGDIKSFVQKYAGTKLSFTYTATPITGESGTIKNTIYQNSFGQTSKTTTMINPLPKMDPKKDIVVNVGDQKSLDGKEIKLGDIFDYKLESSVRPENYGGQTIEWGGTDDFDAVHDEFTGQWEVLADRDIVVSPTLTLEKGTDISRYFTMTFNPEKHRIHFEATPEFDKVLDSPANKGSQQAWSAYVQMKRIAAGKATNVWVETYNNQVVNSNIVTSFTEVPKTPKPAKPTVINHYYTKIVKQIVPGPPVVEKEKVIEKVPTPVMVKSEPKPEVKVATAVAPTQKLVEVKTPVKPQPMTQSIAEVPKIQLSAPKVAKAEQQKPAPAKIAELPHTGESDDTYFAVGGLLALAGMVGAFSLHRKKHSA